MYQVLARKYRPQSFDDVVGQEHVKTTLRNAITQSRIAHGYIFSGQRGTGKTTLARIMARCLNCEKGPTPTPCGICSSCTEIAAGSATDVIEIDAASNRGINEMRELRENVRYQPSRDRFKIFIIDEAHQITNEAFNALLKTIEEPPSWAVFILCTTESHKIPATIVSRCQHFSFRSVDFEELVERMRWICTQEGIDADDEALAVLAQAGEGSVRDSLSALDQAIACAAGRLEGAEVRALLGSFSIDAFARVSESLLSSEGNKMLDLVDELERNGQNLQHFSRELSRYFRNLLVARMAGENTRLIAASSRERSELTQLAQKFSEEDLIRYLQLTLDLYRELQFSLQPRFHLEVGLLRLVHAGRLESIEKILAGLRAEPAPRPLPVQEVKPRPALNPPPSPVRRGPTPFELDRLKKSGAGEPQAAATSGANALAPDRQIDWHAEILEGLHALGLTFTADAISHAEVTANGSEITVKLPPEFKLMTKVGELQQAAQKQQLGAVRFKLLFGDVSAPGSAVSPKPQPENQLSERALAHPEIQRFRETFGGEVRAVRNLKE
jgi:DNA polymerase-3 subunit gamma/tau